MNPSHTNVDERDQWRARIMRALAELQTDAPHIDGRVEGRTDETSADPDSL